MASSRFTGEAKYRWFARAGQSESAIIPLVMKDEPTLSHYSLASSEEEHRRLIALATAEEDRVRDACARAGIGSGNHVVDLGCGPLGALHALASVVGPLGRVVGIDAS